MPHHHPTITPPVVLISKSGSVSPLKYSVRVPKAGSIRDVRNAVVRLVNGFEAESENESDGDDDGEGEGGGEREGGSGAGSGAGSGGGSDTGGGGVEAGATSPQQPPSPKRRVIDAGGGGLHQMPDLSVCERDLVVVDIHLHHIFSLVSLEQKISRLVITPSRGE